MDLNEANDYWKWIDKSEFPPLHESVNGKKSEDKSILCQRVNRALLPFKIFYFFFYGAIGSLFPFIALYFEHLWLSPTQAGLLVGLRPIVQSFSLPLWGILADKCRVKKMVLLIGLCGWLFTHTSILLVPAGEKPFSCNANATSAEIKRSSDENSNYTIKPVPGSETNDENDVIAWEFKDDNFPQVTFATDDPSKHQLLDPTSANSFQPAPSNSAYTVPIEENDELNSNENSLKKSAWNFSSGRTPIQTWHTFVYLGLIIIIGNLFAAPAQAMANTATLEALAADPHKYGSQRYFGSLGWGCAAFVVGMLVSFNHDSKLKCQGLDDINYTPCFYAFGILMLFAFVVSLFLKFEDTGKHSKVEVAICSSLRQELDCLTCFVFFTALLAGFNMGFIQTFLFWYLQTIGGTQKLFSLITGLNAIGEMIGFMLSVMFIERFDHLKVLSIGLLAYAVRLFVYGLVQNPWIVLSVELLKAFTSSAIWASVLSFIWVSNGSGATLVSLLHMLYWGVGYGGAGIIGGVLTQRVGARVVFLALAIISLLDMFAVLLVFHLNCCPKRTRDIYMPVVSDEEDEAEDSESEQ